MRCFSSPGLLPALARRMIGLATDRVAPFGNPGITACLQLPQAYRSLHVLRRLPVPRHPPCALTRLISVSRCDSSTPQHTTRQFSKSGTAFSVVRSPSSLTTDHGPRRTDDVSWSSVESAGDSRVLSRDRAAGYSRLQTGGAPASGSHTATLLRLRPSHRIDLRRLPPCGWPTGFGSLRLPWRAGRCVQGPGTYSPRRG